MTFQPLAWLQAHWISPQEIRAEAWALGGRHQGEVTKGARLEAGAAGVSVRRAILLKAVIRSEKSAGRAKRGRT
jgi:hypothetical protein